MKRTSGLPFLVIGIAFLTIGAGGRRAFATIGLAFIAIGIVFMIRQRRAGRPR
jgi:hypothetical protein